jgi:hypothetical protein
VEHLVTTGNRIVMIQVWYHNYLSIDNIAIFFRFLSVDIAFPFMVLNPHNLWYCLPIMVFLHSKFSHFTTAIWMHCGNFECICVGKKMVLFHWFKSNPTVKLLLVLNNRNCNLVFKIMLVKLQNQIEEREYSY